MGVEQGDTENESPLSGSDESKRQEECAKRLRDCFERSLALITPHDHSTTRFSERWFLRRRLTPYLHEYPFLSTDIGVLTQAQALLSQPLEPPPGLYDGVFDDTHWAAEIRDKQLRRLFEEARSTEHRSVNLCTP